MAEKQRHKKQVHLPQLDELGPIFVQATRNLDKVEAIADAQRVFGGGARVRLLANRDGGRRELLVMLRYTSYRAVIGALDGPTARELYSRVRWLSTFNRAVTCTALLETDPRSPYYLGVWLNPESTIPPID